jgi:hypothetical protein
VVPKEVSPEKQSASRSKANRGFQFSVSAPPGEQEDLTSALKKGGSGVAVRHVRLKRGVADVLKELVGAAPIFLQVAADSLTCIDFLVAYVRSLPKDRSAKIRLVIGDNHLDLTTQDASAIKEAIHGFFAASNRPSPREK